MAFPPISALPSVPQRTQDPATFSANTDAFLSALPTFRTDVNTFGGYLDTTAATVSSDASTSSAAATSATASASAAAAASNFKGAWSSLAGALNKPATVLHKGAYWALLNNLADVTTSEPSVTGDWAFTSGTRWRTLIVASTTLSANSQNNVEATGATIDLTMPTLAANDFIVIHNSSASTYQVRMLNTAYTIRGPLGSLTSSDNLVIQAGGTVHLIANTASILEIA